MRQPLSPEVLETLRQEPTPSVANAIETFNIRSRSEGFTSSAIRCILPEVGPMIGYAATAKIRSAKQPAPGEAVPRREMWEHILSLPAPRVVVIQDLDDEPVGSFWGEVQANIHKALGCVGVVTNGGVRDLDEVREVGFALFAGHIHVSHAYVHVVEVGTPVEVGGLTVHPGDLLLGDQHGVIQIPHEIAADVPAGARQVEARERRIIELCQSDEFSLDRLSELYG